jgi:ribonuclease P/MRP protein subunit RPP40
MLVRTFTCRDAGLWKQLYTSLVRPHLEFASTVWNPYLSGGIKTLEKVQERATRIPKSFKDMAYEERQT